MLLVEIEGMKILDLTFHIYSNTMLCIMMSQPTIITYLTCMNLKLHETYISGRKDIFRLSHSRCQTLWKGQHALCFGDHCVSPFQLLANFRERGSRNSHLRRKKTKV